MRGDKLKFINPYNFVPLVGNKHAEAKDNRNDNLLSGVITYFLLTKTPLFIPDTGESNTSGEEHKVYEFFSYEASKDGESKVTPVIPGSEIRGMLRSNYEILTNSCMSVVDNEKVLNRRSCHVFSPGLLKKNRDGSFDLFKAVDCLWRTKGENQTEDEEKWLKKYGKERRCYIQENFTEGQKVYFSYGKRKNNSCKPLAINVSPDMGKFEGYIIKGEASPKIEDNPEKEKHCCHIFTLKKGGKGVEKITPIKKHVSIEVLENCLAEYEKNKERVQKEYSYKEYAEQFKQFKKQKDSGYFPVYYSTVNNGHIMLSPASITKEIYKHQMKDIVGGFGSCESEPLCPACSLFGMVSEINAFSSRIRLSDLVCQSDKSFGSDFITLPEFSSPKINNVEFYLKRPKDAVFWTYDYYIDEDGELRLWDNPIINGRKFYWHQPEMKLPENVEKDKNNMTIRPVVENVTFKGKLFFDGITETELKQLLWLLNCGEKGKIGDKTHGYKLGMGKPLGFGSVALDVDEVIIRKIEKGEGRIYLKEQIKNNKGQDMWSEECFDEEIRKKVLPMFLKMTQFDLLKGRKVSYPMTVSQMEKSDTVVEGFEWFTKNHYFYNKKNYEVKGIGTDRRQMRLCEYMSAMTPELKAVKNRCVWVSKNQLDIACIEKLKTMFNIPVTIEQKTGAWIQISEIAELAEQYKVLLLPSETYDNIILEANKHFEKVYMANKPDKSKKGDDGGWTEC